MLLHSYKLFFKVQPFVLVLTTKQLIKIRYSTVNTPSPLYINYVNANQVWILILSLILILIVTMN